jgi:hypothetical protein
MKMFKCLALVLVVVGAINWGLWGFFQFDIVAWLCKGNASWLARTVYGVIGLAGVWSIGIIGKCRSGCGCGSSCGCGNGSCNCCKGDKKGSGSCKM